MSLQPPDIDSARYHLDRAKEMMEKLQEHCKEENEVILLSTRVNEI